MTELDLEKKLYNYAIRLLARSEQTAFKLTTKLNQKCITLNQPKSPEIIDKVILKITEAGWLSEKRFVHAFVRTKINQRMGPVKILFELNLKGLTEQKINQFLEDCEAWQEIDWINQAVQVLIKKFGDDQSIIWPKKAKYLQSKGYTSEQIRRALKDSSHFTEMDVDIFIA